MSFIDALLGKKSKKAKPEKDTRVFTEEGREVIRRERSGEAHRESQGNNTLRGIARTLELKDAATPGGLLTLDTRQKARKGKFTKKAT